MISYLTKVIANLMVAVVSASLEENESTPTKVVESVFEEIKHLKVENINIDLEKIETDLINDEDESEIKFYKASKEIINRAQNIEYKINKEIINKGNAVVNVTVKGINLDNLLDKFYNKVLLQGIIDDVNHEEYEKIFLDIIDETEYIETTGKIKLIRNNDKWRIKDKNDITKLIFFMGESSK